MSEKNEKNHRTDRLIKKMAFVVISGGLAFSAPMTPLIISGTETVLADTVGTETNPKRMDYNTIYKDYLLYDEEYYNEYYNYYFETDDNKCGNEYTITIVNNDDLYYICAYVYENGNQWNGDCLYRLEDYDNAGKTSTIKLNLQKNKKYLIKLDCSFINEPYEISISHKTNGNVIKLYNGVWTYYNKNGNPDYSYTGLAKTTQSAWRYVKNGVFDSSWTGLAKSATGKWYYVKNGRYDVSYTGLARSKTGRWYHVTNGKYNPRYTGLSQAASGKWYYVKTGKYDTSFTGLAKAPSGKWYYVKNGKFTKYNGYAQGSSGKWYQVRNGKVV